jgi:hypothetical protein
MQKTVNTLLLTLLYLQLNKLTGKKRRYFQILATLIASTHY